MKKNHQLAQATLEMVITFFVFGLFFLGLIAIWLWSDIQIVGRQQSYESTRISAGTTGAGLTYPVYTPKQLTDRDIILQD